jgi:hypothetical protein
MLVNNYSYNGVVYNGNIFSYRTLKVDNTDNKLVDQPNIYPNPASNSLFLITGKDEKIHKLEIYDATGKLITLAYKDNGGGKIEVNVTSLPNGSYLAKVIMVHKTKSYRFLVMK